MMSLRINIGSSFVAESAFSAALQQCLSLYLRLPSPSTPWSLLQPILPGPHTGDEPVTPQPSAHLCPQPSALPPPGCSSNESWSCRKDLHSPSGIPVHKHPLHPRGAEGLWSLLSGNKGPLWPLPQPVLVGHVLGHQSGQLQPLSSSCSLCAGMTLPDLSTTCLTPLCPGFGLTRNTPNTTLIYWQPFSLELCLY